MAGPGGMAVANSATISAIYPTKIESLAVIQHGKPEAFNMNFNSQLVPSN